MESGEVEKRKQKQEADYAFDPVAATAEQWGAYLLNTTNFEKDFVRGEFPFKAPALSLQEKVRSAGIPRAVVETAVAAALARFDEIVGQKTSFRELSPLSFVALLADEDSLDVVQRLWTDAPKDSVFIRDGLHEVAEGLGEHLPLDQEGLEKLYTQEFDRYSFTALEIMLKRGEKERASELFAQHVEQYAKGCDPMTFDYLVRLGLSVASATKWLDQSINKTKPGYEPWYREALVRWEALQKG